MVLTADSLSLYKPVPTKDVVRIAKTVYQYFNLSDEMLKV